MRCIEPTCGTNHRRLAAISTHPHKARRLPAAEALHHILEFARIGLHCQNAASVGRPRRAVVGGDRLGEPHRLSATIRAHLLDMPTGIAPRDVGNPLPVGRPCGEELAVRGARNTARRAFGEVHHVEIAERGEGHTAAIGGGRGVADLPRHKGRRVLDWILELDLGPNLHIHLSGERDLGGGAAIYWHTPNLAAVADDHVATVGGVAVPRERVGLDQRLHVVALDGIREPAFVARGEFADSQSGLLVVARTVGEPLAVGGDLRPERRAVAAGHGGASAELAVVGDELVLREDGVVLPVPGTRRVPDMAAIGSEGRAHRRLTRGLADQLDARAPVNVIQKEFGPAGHRTRDGDVLAVG